MTFHLFSTASELRTARAHLYGFYVPAYHYPGCYPGYCPRYYGYYYGGPQYYGYYGY